MNAPVNDAPTMYPASVDVFYQESKAARDVMDAVLIRYRTNTTAVLALATGAAGFFGFSNSPKGPLFALALASYAVAAVTAIAIYWPNAWRVNVAHDVEAGLRAEPLTPTKVKWDLARGHQQAIAQSIKVVSGWRGQASKFRILLAATSMVVLFSGVNTYLESGNQTAKPTHIVIDKDAR